jgi:class 3 adenylate cyclase
MKHIIIIFTIIFSCNTLKAELQGQAKIDSLLKELPKMKEDTNGVNLLAVLSKEYESINPVQGIKYGEQGLELALELNWESGEANCYNSLGVNYFRIRNNDKAMTLLNKAIKINTKINNVEGIAKNFTNIGGIYMTQAKYSDALDYYFKSIKKNESINNKRGVATTSYNIAAVYYYLKDYNKINEYLNIALNNYKELGDMLFVADIYSMFAVIHMEQKSIYKSLDYLNKALKISKELNNKELEINLLNNKGIIYGEQNKYNECLIVLNKVLKICKEINDQYKTASALSNIGNLYSKLAQDSIILKLNKESELVSLKKEVNLNKSIDYYKEGLKIFKEIGDIYSISRVLNNLSDVYKQKGNYKNALETTEEARKYKDSIFSQENKDKILALEKAREDDVNKLKIEKQEIQLQAQEDERQLIILSAIGALLSVLIILSVIIIQRRKSEKLLLNVLPAKIAKRLKAKEHPIADHFDGASIIFIDLVSFTKMSSSANPKEIVAMLNDIFTIFDKLADKHGLEKIKTIGDAYMAVAGIPEIQADHAKRTAQMALDIKQEMKDYKTADGTEIHFRIGIDCGAVVAGVIGEKKFIYDLWSDAVNTASRMESTGESGQIQITENFKEELEKFDGNWNFTLRGEFDIKGKGLMKTYYLGN